MFKDERSLLQENARVVLESKNTNISLLWMILKIICS
jgi:hypothetical protein